MKLQARVLLVVAAALAGAALAQESPSDVSDGEIARYKATVEQSCREPGVKRGDPKEYIDAVCNCIVATLQKNLKRTEWQQLYFYSFKTKQLEEEMLVLEPHIKALSLCKQAKP